MNKEDLESKLNNALGKFAEAETIKAWGQIADAADTNATVLTADRMAVSDGSYHAMADRAADRSPNTYFSAPSSISYSGPDPEEKDLDEIGEMIGARKAFAARAKGGFELLEAVLEMTAEPHLFFSSPRFTAYGEDYSLSVRLSMQGRLFASELFRAPDRLFLTGYLQRVDEFLVSENREMRAMGWTLDEGAWTKGIMTRGGVKKAAVSFRDSPGLCFSLSAGG
ncbi:MAG: hypothetical protein J6Y62_10080, partial [Clostridia bacterium]|nr:hypothetical protein [Clostridia bacterium]